jgi:hypothetical protein
LAQLRFLRTAWEPEGMVPKPVGLAIWRTKS